MYYLPQTEWNGIISRETRSSELVDQVGSSVGIHVVAKSCEIFTVELAQFCSSCHDLLYGEVYMLMCLCVMMLLSNHSLCYY